MTYLPTLSLLAVGLASVAIPAVAGPSQVPELLPEHQEQLSARRLRNDRDDSARLERLRLDAQRQLDAQRSGTGGAGDGDQRAGERHRVGKYRIDCLDCNFPGTALRPVKVNSSGTVAANELATGQGYLIAGGAITVAPLAPGATFSTVSDINDQGHLVGVQAMAGSSDRGYLWRYGAMSMIDGPNGGTASPRAINAADQVTGSASGSGPYGAFLYLNGALAGLPSPPNHSYSWGTGINVAGHVVGSSYTGGVYSDPDGWRYADGALTVLSPQFVSTYANAVNDLDEVAGSVDSYAAYWSASGRLQILNTLPNFSTGTATAINIHGVVVGILAGNNSAAWPRIAFMWDGRTVYDLNTLIQGGTTSGWTLNEATSINDGGVIVGVGMLNGWTHAFMATPLRH